MSALQAGEVCEDVTSRLLLAVVELVQLVLVHRLELHVEQLFLSRERDCGDGRGGGYTGSGGYSIVRLLRLCVLAGDDEEDAQLAETCLHGRAPCREVCLLQEW
jgi:hypothetical protein